MKCTKCGSTHVVKNGYNSNGSPRYKCKECDSRFTYYGGNTNEQKTGYSKEQVEKMIGNVEKEPISSKEEVVAEVKRPALVSLVQHTFRLFENLLQNINEIDRLLFGSECFKWSDIIDQNFSSVSIEFLRGNTQELHSLTMYTDLFEIFKISLGAVNEFLVAAHFPLLQNTCKGRDAETTFKQILEEYNEFVCNKVDDIFEVTSTNTQHGRIGELHIKYQDFNDLLRFGNVELNTYIQTIKEYI